MGSQKRLETESRLNRRIFVRLGGLLSFSEEEELLMVLLIANEHHQKRNVFQNSSQIFHL